MASPSLYVKGTFLSPPSTPNLRWIPEHIISLLISQVVIREYKPTDFDRLYEIDHQAFTKEIAYSHLELQYYLRSRKCRTLVAEDEGEVVGFVIGCSEPRKLGHIITIDVAPHRH